MRTSSLGAGTKKLRKKNSKEPRFHLKLDVVQLRHPISKINEFMSNSPLTGNHLNQTEFQLNTVRRTGQDRAQLLLLHRLFPAQFSTTSFKRLSQRQLVSTLKVNKFSTSETNTICPLSFLSPNQRLKKLLSLYHLRSLNRLSLPTRLITFT